MIKLIISYTFLKYSEKPKHRIYEFFFRTVRPEKLQRKSQNSLVCFLFDTTFPKTKRALLTNFFRYSDSKLHRSFRAQLMVSAKCHARMKQIRTT